MRKTERQDHRGRSLTLLSLGEYKCIFYYSYLTHDGSPGTYVNKDVDEDSAKKIGQINGNRTESTVVVDESLKDKIKEGTDAYNKAVENGDVRNLFEIIDKNRMGNGTENKYLNAIYQGRDNEINVEKILNDYKLGTLDDMEKMEKFIINSQNKQRLAEDLILLLFLKAGIKETTTIIGVKNGRDFS